MYGVGLFSVNCLLRPCLSPAETRMIATFYTQFHIATHSKHRHDLLDEREKREGQKKKSVNLSRIIISTIDYSPAFKNIN
jgi:hypothetical protein